MTAGEIFRDWRVQMIAGATLLHLGAIAGALVMQPPGVETRLNRPIEASFAPAPSSQPVNMNSAPLAQEVQSAETAETAATEDSAEVVPPDAVKTETVTAPSQQSARTDAVAVETSEMPLQSSAQPETVAAQMPTETVKASEPAPAVAALAQLQQDASLAPDVLTTASPVESTEVPLVSPEAAPAQDMPPKPAAEAPKQAKPAKPTHQPKRKPEAAKLRTPAATPVQESRFARLDDTTQVRRAQKGGAGAISDIGMAEQARTSGASVQSYAAMLKAAVLGRMRAMGDIGCQGGARASVAAVISPQGRIGSVRLVSASGDTVLDRAALAAVRSASLPTPPNKAIPAIIPLSCPRS